VCRTFDGTAVGQQAPGGARSGQPRHHGVAGQEKLHYLNAEPINAIADRWINQYDRARAQTLADLKTALESESMSSSTEFVYTTYIKTTPERLWQALTDPAFSRNYLGFAIESDWKKGSTYVWD
jgi:hypothetical protein